MNTLALRTIVGICCVLTIEMSYTQIFYSEGATIVVNPGAIVQSNGGVVLDNETSFSNNGELIVTKNSTAGLSGNFELRENTQVEGDGIYRVEQDWVNDAVFISGNSEVVLFGNQQQFITSNNGTVTTFNHLSLTGNGVDENSRKTLLNVDGFTAATGILNLNNRELYTGEHVFTVLNPAVDAIQNETTFGEEGFVSSVNNGALIREIPTEGNYIFPVGSSEDVRRYRPIKIQPTQENENAFAVRMNNYAASLDGLTLTNHDSKIESTNASFYHTIQQVDGSGAFNLQVFFVPEEDKDWESTAYWSGHDLQWNNMLNVHNNTAGNFKYITKNAWTDFDEQIDYVLVKNDYSLMFAEVISPNGDGLNDYFIVDGLTAYPNSDVRIYNRWGAEVYHSDDYQNDWDGRSQSNLNIGGDELPEGTYYYVLQLGGSADQPGHGEIHKGFIYLKR